MKTLTEVFTRFVGPAALTAAGMIGAGATRRLDWSMWPALANGLVPQVPLNQPEYRANAGRHAVLAVTFLFTLALVVNGLR